MYMSKATDFEKLSQEDQKRVRHALLTLQRPDDPTLRAGVRALATKWRRQMHWVIALLPLYASALVVGMDVVSGRGAPSVRDPSFLFPFIVMLILVVAGWFGMNLWARHVIRVNN
jgi:hypothetical protein